MVTKKKLASVRVATDPARTPQYGSSVYRRQRAPKYYTCFGTENKPEYCYFGCGGDEKAPELSAVVAREIA